jgi:hypothetical protein
MRVSDSALAVVRALERLGVRHYVTGSLASSLHGDPRATNDADVVAALHEAHFERFRKELGDRFYLDAEEFLRATRTHRSFNLVDEVELAKVDVFCVSSSGYQALALTRAVVLELEPGDPFTRVHVASATDVVLSKLRWYQLGGEVSDRQWRDLLGIVKAQGSRLDLDHARRWSTEQGTAELLGRLLAEAGA